MRLGIYFTPQHDCPQEWAEKLIGFGCRAAVFPCEYTTDQKKIDGYVKACEDNDLVIAEVGAWCNPMDSDIEKRKKNIRYCQEQLRLADYIGAKCCVNVAGCAHEKWDGGYPDNYSDETYDKIVSTTREIIDTVNPTRSFYTLEPMPWMVPFSPESYKQLLSDVDRNGFGVHMDIVNMMSCPEKYLFQQEFIQKCFSLLGQHTKSCHVKDTHLEQFLTLNLKECACGDGEFDIPFYAKQAEECDPQMPFIIEHLNTEEEYIAALNYVRSVIDNNLINSSCPKTQVPCR